ncbi:hypothetical protein LTR08_001160 [Meristemomyces frigidus]|nr:hypothetical protein LTR08_001160 [Meristemomyces frigidus]
MAEKTEAYHVRTDQDGPNYDDPSPVELQDKADMDRMGRNQELERNFRPVSLLGLTCVVMGTWLGMITSSGFSLINGGRAGTIWVYTATWLFSLPVAASMAEMASMAPSAGGQCRFGTVASYDRLLLTGFTDHWVSEFAPVRTQKFLSYISGWLSALGWQAFIAVSAYQAGNLILILASVGYPGYTPTAWQGTLITIAVALFATAFNTFAAKKLPLFEGVILFVHILGFFAILIPLWTLAPMARSSEVFGSFSNYGGWSSVGGACLVGQLASAGAFIGVDSAAHLSEEVKNASLVVPRMMVLTVLANGAMGLVMIVTYVFAIQDVEEQIVNSTAVYPFIDVFEVATGSRAGAIGMATPIVILSISMCMNATAAASRQLWSFGSDDGLPYNKWFTKITKVNSTLLPVNALFSSLFIVVVLALLNLGGSEAFNSILGLVTGAVGLTYALSIGCVLWRRLFGAPLPPARWSLGRSGAFVNAIALCYEILTTVISFFPLFAEVTARTMNWAIAMFGGVAIICSINYVVSGRRIYKGPVVRVNSA